MKQLDITWDEFNDDMDRLKKYQFKIGAFDSECVVSVLNGGKYFGEGVAKILEVPHYTLDVSSYDGRGKKDLIYIKDFRETLAAITGKRVLIVDDVLDSGLTMRLVRGLMWDYASRLLGYVYVAKRSMPSVGHYLRVDEDCWVNFPWE